MLFLPLQAPVKWDDVINTPNGRRKVLFYFFIFLPGLPINLKPDVQAMTITRGITLNTPGRKEKSIRHHYFLPEVANGSITVEKCPFWENYLKNIDIATMQGTTLHPTLNNASLSRMPLGFHHLFPFAYSIKNKWLCL